MGILRQWRQWVCGVTNGHHAPDGYGYAVDGVPAEYLPCPLCGKIIKVAPQQPLPSSPPGMYKPGREPR